MLLYYICLQACIKAKDEYVQYNGTTSAVQISNYNSSVTENKHEHSLLAAPKGDSYGHCD